MKKIIASISVTKNNVTDIEKKYSEYDVIEGRFEVAEGAAISLPNACKLGDIIAHDDAIITLSAVKETGHILVYRGATITLTSATKTRDVAALQEAKITLPSAVKTRNVYAGQDAIITLPAAIRTGGVTASKGATISLPKAEKIGLVVAEEGALISLLHVKERYDITAKEGAIIVMPRWALSSPCMHVDNNALLVNGFVDPHTASGLELVKAMAIAWAQNKQISVEDAEQKTLSLVMSGEKGHEIFHERIWGKVSVPLSSVLKKNVPEIMVA